MKGSFEVDNYEHKEGDLFIRGHLDARGKSTLALSMNEYFSRFTLKVMFWAQFDIDYCGG